MWFNDGWYEWFDDGWYDCLNDDWYDWFVDMWSCRFWNDLAVLGDEFGGICK